MKEEYGKATSCSNKFVLDELNLLVLIGLGAIWVPVFLDGEEEIGDFSGVLLFEKILRLSFSVLVCQSLVRIFLYGFSIVVKRIDNNGEVDALLQDMAHVGRYVDGFAKEGRRKLFLCGPIFSRIECFHTLDIVVVAG